MSRVILALFGVLGALCLGGCVAPPPIQQAVERTYTAPAAPAVYDDGVEYEATTVYDPNTTYFAVADRPGEFFYYGSGCSVWTCVSSVSLRTGYWPRTVVYYDTYVDRRVISHDRWVSHAHGHGWNRAVLQAHSGWRHHGPAVRPGGQHVTGGFGGTRDVHNDGRGVRGGHGTGQQVVNRGGNVPSTGIVRRDAPPAQQIVNRRPPQPMATTPTRVAQPTRSTPPPRACGRPGQPRC